VNGLRKLGDVVAGISKCLSEEMLNHTNHL
jgi:hypothetical protein